MKGGEPMGTTGKRLGIAALAMCLLVALAFGGISAFADASWQGDAYGNSLTVEATDTESMSEDIAKADVVVDIYRVASAEKDSNFDTYNYTWEAPFDEGPVKTEGLDANAWNKLAADAAQKNKRIEARNNEHECHNKHGAVDAREPHEPLIEQVGHKHEERQQRMAIDIVFGRPLRHHVVGDGVEARYVEFPHDDAPVAVAQGCEVGIVARHYQRVEHNKQSQNK